MHSVVSVRQEMKPAPVFVRFVPVIFCNSRASEIDAMSLSAFGEYLSLACIHRHRVACGCPTVQLSYQYILWGDEENIRYHI